MEPKIEQLCPTCLSSARKLGQLGPEVDGDVVQVLKRQTCKDLMGSDKLFVNQSLEKESIKEEELKMVEDDNKKGDDNEEGSNKEVEAYKLEKNKVEGSNKEEYNKDNKEVEEKSEDIDETDSTVLCRNAHCLGSLLQSWVVENYLEVAETKTVCHYYLKSKTCPYEQVGCMFSHEEEEVRKSDDLDLEGEEKLHEELEEQFDDQRIFGGDDTGGSTRQGRTMTRRNIDRNIKRLRDLSITCS